MKIKKKITQKNNKKLKFIPLNIFIICIIMSIGYATINSINLDVTGEMVAYEPSGVIIEEVNYLSSNNADTTNSKINKTTGSILNSTVVLSPTDASSSITYQITLYNLNEYNYRFIETTYEPTFYDNENITYELNGITTDTVINSNERITFDITFKYKDNITPSNITNTLNSYIQFIFGFTDTIVGNYSYTGDYQTFIAPKTGTYKIELWGASGGRDMLQGELYDNNTGLGGYTSGTIYLKKGDTLYVYVGGKGQDAVLQGNSKGGYNGGGDASFDKIGDDEASGAGGGATDVRLVSGVWNDETSLKSRIMVAGAGASERVWKPSKGTGILANYVSPYCAGGGLSGYTMVSTSSPGTQTTGYAFGYGESRVGGSSDAGDGGLDSGLNGGGGGYYGGTSGDTKYYDIAAGGSSFISGHNGCVAIESATSLTPRVDSTGTQCTDGTTDITCSYHYSNYVFENTEMIDGAGYKWTTTKEATQTGMPQISGSGVMNGNSGNGHAKITLLDFVECPDNNQICDLSGNNNHLNIVGATWDKNTGEISTDGIDDYLYIDMLEWNDTSEFTIEFYAQLDGSTKGLFFESSANSNNNYGSFYVNTKEYGTNDLTLAMKFNTSSSSFLHHRHVDNFIDSNNYHHYVLTLNTNDVNKSFIKMYKDGVQYQTKNPISTNHDITGVKLKDYPFYIGTRNGNSLFQKLKIKTLRIYTKELTIDEIRRNYNGANFIKDDLIVHFDFKN